MIFPRKTIPHTACFQILTFLFVVIVLSGCAGPIGVTRLTPQDSYKFSTDNVLGAGKISDSTKTVLQRYNLLATLNQDSLKTIQTLHDISRSDDRRDILFALSELSYLKGGKM